MNYHNDTFCTKYKDTVLPDEEGNCSLCGATIRTRGNYWDMWEARKRSLEAEITLLKRKLAKKDQELEQLLLESLPY